MSLRDFIGLLFRWKWVLVPGLLLAVAGGLTASLATPLEYSRTETYLLLSPVQTEVGPTNPYLNAGNGVAMTAAVLAAKVTDGDTVRELTTSAPELEYSVAVDSSVSDSLLRVTVTDRDRTAVAAVLQTLGERLTSELATLQQDSGAPDNSFVTIRQFTEDPKTTTGYGDSIRNGVGAGIGLVLVVMVVLVLLERARLGRLRGDVAPAADGHSPPAAGAGRPAGPRTGETGRPVTGGNWLSPTASSRHPESDQRTSGTGAGTESAPAPAPAGAAGPSSGSHPVRRRS